MIKKGKNKTFFRGLELQLSSMTKCLHDSTSIRKLFFISLLTDEKDGLLKSGLAKINYFKNAPAYQA
jgi:hypothetical protein